MRSLYSVRNDIFYQSKSQVAGVHLWPAHVKLSYALRFGSISYCDLFELWNFIKPYTDIMYECWCMLQKTALLKTIAYYSYYAMKVCFFIPVTPSNPRLIRFVAVIVNAFYKS